MVNITLFTGFYISQVVLEFFHHQYDWQMIRPSEHLKITIQKCFQLGTIWLKHPASFCRCSNLFRCTRPPFMIFGLVLVLGTGHCFEECRWRTGNCQSYTDQLLRLLGWFILPQRWTRDWMHWTLRWQKHFSWKLTHFTTDSCHPRQILRGA